QFNLASRGWTDAARHLARHIRRRTPTRAAPALSGSAPCGGIAGSSRNKSSSRSFGHNMPIAISTRFAFSVDSLSDVLLQFEAAAIPEQSVVDKQCDMTKAEHIARIAAQDGIGERIWLHVDGHFEVQYTATVAVNRILAEIDELNRLEPHHLPAEAVQYLLDSRYCPSDRFQSFVEAEFGGTSGGKRIIAIRDWISGNFVYAPVSTASTTALDSFV